MRVSANPVLFALFDKWRGNVSSLEFDGTRFVFAGRNLPLASLESMQNCPVVRPGWLGNELSIPFGRSGAPLRIRGKDSGALAALGDSIEKAWRNHNVERYKARSADINTVLGTVRDLARPNITLQPVECSPHWIPHFPSKALISLS